MKKIVSFLILIFGLLKITYSESISKEQAELVGRNFYFEHINYIRQTEFKSIQADKVFEIKSGGIASYYVINFTYEGFVIVAADDRVTPILGYAFESRYSELNQPPAFIRWMQDYEKQIQLIIKKNLIPNPSVASEWKKYGTNNPSLLLSNKSNIKQVVPMVKTIWNQDKYYNNLCPAASGGPDGYCYSGCVPTAMGQIMNYYRYPAQGTGTYKYKPADFDSLSADFGNTIYRWDQMPLEVTDRQNDSAVATLLYHLGVSVDMDYGPDGSGMFNHSAARSLRNYFKYSQHCQYIFRDTATHTNWKQLILNHLDQKKPLYYAGWADTNNISGHAFVCDGYQDTSYFHFNWGWAGQDDGYFIIDNLTPSGNDFTLDHELILNFYPDSSADYPALCQNNSIMTHTKGTLSDGSGPLYKYKNNMDCEWLIQPKDSVSSIKLTFLEFKTQSDSDKIIVYNGPSIASPVLGAFSGSNIPSPIITAGTSLLVRFITDDSITDEGWLASYETTSAIFCSGIKNMTTASGSFSDGSGNFVYHPNELCRWNIQPTGATSIQLHFSAFDIAAGDYLKVTDIVNNQVLATLTGSIIPADVTCNSSNMLVLFKSFDKNLTQGFSGNYFTTNSINENNPLLNNIIISPNPTKDYFILQTKNATPGYYNLAIYTIDGRQVHSESFELKSGGFEKTINISLLKSGMYLLSLCNKNENYFTKIIKE